DPRALHSFPTRRSSDLCRGSHLQLKNQLRMPSGELIDDGRYQSTSYGFIASNAQLARSRVGEKFDLLHALPQLVEDGHAAFAERSEEHTSELQSRGHLV